MNPIAGTAMLVSTTPERLSNVMSARNEFGPGAFALALILALTGVGCGSASQGETGLVQLNTEPSGSAALEATLAGNVSGGDTSGQGEFNGTRAEDASEEGREDAGMLSDGEESPLGDIGPALEDALLEDTSNTDSVSSEEDATESADAGSEEDISEAEEDSGPEPLCTPGSTSCEGNAVVVCSPSGDTWITVTTCPEESACLEGACCAPSCEGKSCGDDGCGGLCGSCEAGSTCDSDGACVELPACTEGETCEDGDPCTEGGLCVQGSCVSQPKTCDDGDPCTTDKCGPQGCSFAPKNCSDGDPCTADSCGSQGCVNAPIDCDDDNTCTEDSCGDEGCVNLALGCDDGDPCTDDGCSEDGCIYTPTNCDDGDLCTADSCESSGCIHLEQDCDDALGCTADSCFAGNCEHKVLADSCLIEGECVTALDASPLSTCMACVPELSNTSYSPTPGASCDDGDACTSDDLCQITDTADVPQCLGLSIIEQDTNPCTEQVCLAGEVSEKELNGVTCVSTDPCSSAGSCLDGLCEPLTPCECYNDDDCSLSEVCDSFECSESFCGNGVCDAGDDVSCPQDCITCPSALWCNGQCDDPITGSLACSQDCCGDGFCALHESAACCPDDCSPKSACEDALSVSEVPTLIQGNHNQSNALVATSALTCGNDLPSVNFGFGDGREDLIRFTAPFNGTFLFELEGPWNSQIWFFEDCDAPSESCIETGPPLTGNGSISELDMEANASIMISVDSVSIYYGAGAYSLAIDGLCAPNCQGKACGDDGCGGSCGTCNGSKICSATGACLNADEVCDYHLDCINSEICGYWPTDELNRCSALCKGPANCSNGQLCERVPGAAHIAYCRAKGDKLDIGDSCTSASECDSSLCIQGACSEECITHKGCPNDEVCRSVYTNTGLSAACVPPSGGLNGDACGNCASGHCDVFAQSPGAVCADLCVTPSDCDEDQTCYLIDQSGQVNLSTVPYNLTYPDPLNDALMGCYSVEGGLGSKSDGEVCGANSDCESGRCLPLGAGGQYYCSRPCYKNGDCQNGMSCYLTGTNLVSAYLEEQGNYDGSAYSLVRICSY